MDTISLNRRFLPWSDRELHDPELLGLLPRDGTFRWPELLAKNRVVILAEAGSGKSTELQAQANQVRRDGRFVFHATLQDIGQKSFVRAIGDGASADFSRWKSSDQPAWFFLDSVDEAKTHGVKLEAALREVAEAIQGCQSRAHIVLSGRPTDWEPRRDLASLERWLPRPPADQTLPSIDPNKLMISVLRRDQPHLEPAAAEAPLVVVMGQLDRGQVETFAKGKGVHDLPQFISALEDANLWHFARRPLDLDWLVGYWRKQGRFGRLEQMLELSLKERLKETDVDRDRRNPLDLDRSIKALERIGAAMVLQRLADVTIPDSTPAFDEPPRALCLEEILPDWAGVERKNLSLRAVFDPSRAGFVRLHNDNEGVVRSYLAARWLHRLGKANCPRSAVARLLFSRQYGIALVKPSMRQTAAWLAIWEPDIAQTVAERDPLLLMDAGDPASLPLEVRSLVLGRVIASAVAADDVELPDSDSLKRFSSPDMAPHVRALWTRHCESEPARSVLLSVIWLGAMNECADIAMEASFGAYADHHTPVFSGRALMAASDMQGKRRYVEYVREHAKSLSATVVSEAVEELFPAVLSVSDFLTILREDTLLHRSDHRRLEYLGPRLVRRLETVADLRALLVGLSQLAEAQPKFDEDHQPLRDDPFVSTIEAAAVRLMELSDSYADLVKVTDAAIYVGHSLRYRPRSRIGDEDAADLFALLQSTPERRRSALWHVAQRFPATTDGAPIVDSWKLELKGFAPRFRSEDLEWLLEDAAQRPLEKDRCLAANAIMGLWRDADRDAFILARIRAIASSDAAVANVVRGWTSPPPQSVEDRKLKEEIRRLERRNSKNSEKADQSWIEFAEQLRANPDQLRKLHPPGKNGVDVRLYNIWQLIHAVGFNQNRYAIDDLNPLIPILGPEVVSAASDALMDFWRKWRPTLRVHRPPEERNGISSLDCMGIAGVSLESVSRRDWASQLTPDEAELATTYATLELNGFPQWLPDVASIHPAAVRDVLLQTVEPNLSAGAADTTCQGLRDLASAHEIIVSLMAPAIYRRILQEPCLSPDVLSTALRILVRGFQDRVVLAEFLRQQFRSETVLDSRVAFGVALFSTDAEMATSELMEALAQMEEPDQTALAQALLPKAFGDRFFSTGIDLRSLPFQSLKTLVRIAFRTVRLDDDNSHSDCLPYSPDARDHAESARSALFRALVETPGHATFDVIQEFIGTQCLGVAPKYLARYAYDRAAKDSEAAPWRSSEVAEFENDSLTVPYTAQDLQRVLVERLEDLEHDLIHADFAQGSVVAALPHEVDVQRWFANTLRERQGRSYSIEREPHVANEKEPDIRSRTKALDAGVPIEVKVAESWSIGELDDALTRQLIDQYLRDRNDRYGVLLLVHQSPRENGWPDASGKFLSYAEVVEHLRTHARAIAVLGPSSAQVEVISVDVSRFRSGAKTARKQTNSGKVTGTAH